MKKKIQITSLARPSNKKPWRVGVYIDERYTYFTIGENGTIAMSPRFQLFVREVEKSVSRYPVDISFHGIKGDREIEVAMMSERIVFVDCGLHAQRMLRKASFYYEDKVLGKPMEMPAVRPSIRAQEGIQTFRTMDQDNEGGGGDPELDEGLVEGSLSTFDMDYLAIARIAEVFDGDTFKLEMVKRTDTLSLWTGEDVTVRLNGVDTPEKKSDEANAYKDRENGILAKTYGVEVEDIYKVADEATNKAIEILGTSNNKDALVIVHFDRKKNGSKPEVDPYGRFIADIYATQEISHEILLKKIEAGQSFVHLAKSLVVTKSKHSGLEHIPLGQYNFQYAQTGTVLSPYGWIGELDIDIFDPGGQVTDFAGNSATENKEGWNIAGGPIYEETVNTDTIEFASDTTPKKNTLEFFEPYDDRLDEFVKGIETVEDLKKHPKMRIGDVLLTIPPLSIRTSRISNINRIKTMRTKSSVMVNSGQTLSTITLDLYFHDLESINGKKIEWKEDTGKYHYVDGLRPLLAQFAKAPFVPIYNYYVNDTLGIMDVGLLDIEVTTVPNFPQSLSARVTLVEFNSEAYTMNAESLADGINFPLMRWYYNQSMVDRGEKYRHFKALNATGSSDMKFKLASQEYLAQRKEAMSYLKSADSPEKVKSEMMAEGGVYENKQADQKRVNKILGMKNRYDQIKSTKGLIIDEFNGSGRNKEADKASIMFVLQNTDKLKPEEAENRIAEGSEHYESLYGDSLSAEDLTDENDVFLPYESRPFYGIRYGIEAIQGNRLAVDYTKAPYKTFEKFGLLVIKSNFIDIENKEKMAATFSEYLSDGRYMIPATSTNIEKLSFVTEAVEAVEGKIEEYEKDFNRMMRIVEASESGVPMLDYEIPGGIIPISLQTRFENQFSMAHVQASEAVSLQYMGGGDPSLEFMIEVTEEGAKAFNEMIATSDYYAKTFNQGITNGYIGIENDLAQLFGIRTIMIESLSISTVQGFPDRFQIMIKAVAFDKTQRQREELVALPGNSENMDRDMLVSNRNAFANDRMIESRLPNLEVYPDMELPTYASLNADLPFMDCGGLEKYLNHSGAVYLDPDFYFSTKNTFRSLIEDTYTRDDKLYMYDMSGIAAFTSNGMVDKMFDMAQGDWDKMKDLQETEGVGPIDWVFSWGDEKEDTEKEDESSSGYIGPTIAESNKVVTLGNSEVKAFFEEKVGDELAYKTFPGEAEWKRLFGDEYNYQKFVGKPEGDEAEIYSRISSLVDVYFKDVYTNPDFIEECKGDMEKADSDIKFLAYQPPESIYETSSNVNYSQLSVTVGMKAPIQLRDYLEEQGREVPSTARDGKQVKGSSAFTTGEGKMPKERLVTLIKAFLDKTSQWKHYKNKEPLMGPGRIGIGQVDISGESMTTDEAKRLLYNWDYNLSNAVYQLSTHYKKASKKLEDDFSNWEIYCRPWDAMFAYYEDPDKKIQWNEDIDGEGLSAGVMIAFTKYATKPFNTYSGFNQTVYNRVVGLSDEEKISVGLGSKKQYIDQLIELEYYVLDVVISDGLDVKEMTKEQLEGAMRPYLDKMSVNELVKAYQAHLKFLYELSNTDHVAENVADSVGNFLFPQVTTENYDGPVGWVTDMLAGGKEDVNGYKYSKAVFEKGEKLYRAIKDLDESAEFSTGATDTRLYNDVDPRVLYKEMFHDLRYNDHRGRLLRAFPAFQMFIIHEGDYFGKYKFWDNMYGFNAIESIDVHRSRKIAADTAIISMTNVYSNLTTRRTDIDYIDRQMKWWDNYIWNKVPQDMIDKKENETHKNIFLETGARIHLRMGYGSAAQELPVVFNGTISEIEVGDVVQVVAQGDGIELGNTISGDPDDDNKGLFKIEEPRDLICSLLSSKGSWLKDYLNNVSEGHLMRNNPLGIMHFGQPFDTNDSTAARPLGNLMWFNDEYGEVAQNIYSSNGSPTFSQWAHPNGDRNDFFTDFSWSKLWENKFKIFNPGDEKNVKVKFYNQTVWDVVQTIAYSSPDYIAAVMPFEQRSTLFFGKPYWRAAYQYGSRYEFDRENKTWARHLVSEARRPYMQMKMYSSAYDIIQNNIRASEDNVFTNVVVNYGKHQTPVIYADNDIRYDKLKTRVVEANIVGTFADFYTSEVMATHYGMSTLRDSMKDMYQGDLLVMGDPTVKPHDMMGIMDEINDMSGHALVKSVTHHFSLDTGFITSIQPDLYAVNDDMVMMELGKWYNAYLSSVAVTVLTLTAGIKGGRGVTKWMQKDDIIPKKVARWSTTKSFKKVLDKYKGAPDMDDVAKTLQDIIDRKGEGSDELYKKLSQQFKDASSNLEKIEAAGEKVDPARRATVKSGMKLAKMLDAGETVGKTALKLSNLTRRMFGITPIGFIVNMGVWIGSEMLFEHYTRNKESMQTVVAMPLTYRGKELTAGINNHAGMIYGDAPGRMDLMYDAQLFHDDGEAEFFGNIGIELMNFLTNSGGVYADGGKKQKLDEIIPEE